MACHLPLFIILALFLASTGADSPTNSKITKHKHPLGPIRYEAQCYKSHELLAGSIHAAKNRYHAPLNLKRKNNLLWYVMALLLIHDTELNPGPTKYPCGTCNRPVARNQKGVCCDSCDTLYHINCQNIGNVVYKCLNKTNVSWECIQCGMPNFSSSLFDTPISPVTTPNPYSPIQVNSPVSVTHGSPGPPIAASSPNIKVAKKTPLKKPLRVLNVNCQSVCPKKGEFQNLINNTSPHIVVATETWLTEGDHKDGEIGEVNKFSSDYNIYRKDRKDGYGGVFVAVTKDLISERAVELETEAEMVWVRINMAGSKSLYVSSCYRPQEGDELGHEQFKASVDRLSGYPNAHIWIAGDLNFPGIDWETKGLKPTCRHPRLHQDMLDYLDGLGLEQVVKEPTRGLNTLDLFITNNSTLVNEVQVIPGISDHQAVLADCDLTPITNKQPKRKIPLYSKTDWESLKAHVKAFGDTLDRTADTNTLWLSFKAMLESGIAKYVPHRNAKRKDSMPWITSTIKRLMGKRDKLYAKYKHSGLDKHHRAFKSMKTEVQKQLRQAYWSYVQDLVTPDPSDQSKGNKKFWTFFKHCKQDSTGVAPLIDENGKLENDAEGKAEILNKQFTSVFSKLSPLSLAQSSAQVLRRNFTKMAPSSGGQEYVSPHSSMPDFNITVNGVTKLLKNLKPHKAAGPDSIRPLILKELHLEISPILTLIFQRSLDTGEVPDEWRQANVAPIYKKGPKQIPANYRPVSLTCICSKLMEHILSSNFMRHLEANNILYGKQHGFRAKRSCETQLLELVEDLHRNIQAGQQTDLIVMDFAKAFDKVSHARLLHKLEWYGVRGKANRWVQNFLTDRKQQVVIDGQCSKESWVTSGVPQGSVLGPILFLIYINDLPSCVHSQVRLFADDTILYRNIRNSQDECTLQRDLKSLEDWEQKWLMEFHPGKCQVIRVTRSRSPITTKYFLHNQQLEVVSSTKYLGLTITNDLSWNKHISNVASKANRTLGLVKRNLKISSPSIKEQAYNALVRPLTEYSAAVWDPYTQCNIHSLEMVQRRAARWTLNRYHNTSSVSDMLDHLNWPTLQYRRSDARLCLMYKMVYNLVAVDINEYVTPVLRATRHSHPHSFIQIRSRSESYRMSFFPRTVVEWNLLPVDVVLAPSLEAFKGRLATLRHLPAKP